MYLTRSVVAGNRRKLAYRVPISTRFLPLNGDDNNAAFTTQTWVQSRTKYVLRGASNDFIADSWGFNLVNNAGSEVGQTARTVRAKLEYPEGNFYDFTWAGSVTKSITSGTTSNLSDILRIPGGVPGGGIFYIHWEEVGTAYTVNAAGKSLAGESYGSGTGSAPTLGSSYSGSTANTKICMPNMVTAMQSVSRPLVAFLGDSNMVDQTQTRDAQGIASFPRAISPNANCLKFCMSGNSLSYQVATFTYRKTVMQNYGIKHCFVLLGTNDLPASGDSSAGIITNLDSMASLLAGVGVTPHFMTLPPKSGGAEATRVPVNAYIRSASGTGNYGAYFELADIVETARDSGTWKTGYTNGDLLHILWTNNTEVTAIVNALGNLYSTLK